jgi:hypothetical protein
MLKALKCFVGSYNPDNGTYALGELYQARMMAADIIARAAAEGGRSQTFQVPQGPARDHSRGIHRK